MKLKTTTMAQMPHQRRMHPILTEAGYTFQRNSNGHNRYINEHGQQVTVPGSPKNQGHSERHIRNEIKRNLRQLKENKMPVMQTVDPVDAYLALADPFTVRPATDTASRKAKNTAAIGWVRRICERHGPVTANDLTRAIERIGISPSTVRHIKNDAGIVSYRIKNDKGEFLWMNCLHHQVPEGHSPRHDQAGRNIPKHGVQVELSDPNEAVPSPALVEATNGTEPEAEPLDLSPIPKKDPATGEVNAAALMLLESLGIKMPGEAARIQLQNVEAELHQIKGALDSAFAAIARAKESLA